jgi:hypothetical protein
MTDHMSHKLCLRAAVLALMLFSLPLPAGAAPTDVTPHFAINDRNPEENIPSEAQRRGYPHQFRQFLEDLIERAAAATRRGDHLAAARYYSALAKAEPTESFGFAQLCHSLESLGELEGAMEACGDALSRSGAGVEDIAHYAHLVLGKSGPLNGTERVRVEDQIRRLRRHDDGRVAADQLQCELAQRVGDVPMLEECTASLSAVAASDPKTIAFEWALAMDRREHGRAAELIERARRAGLAPQALREMESATSAVSPGWRQLAGDVRLMLLAFLVGGALLLRRSLLSGQRT